MVGQVRFLGRGRKYGISSKCGVFKIVWMGGGGVWLGKLGYALYTSI